MIEVFMCVFLAIVSCAVLIIAVAAALIAYKEICGKQKPKVKGGLRCSKCDQLCLMEVVPALAVHGAEYAHCPRCDSLNELRD